MAGDWIKMRVDLQTHPKIFRISSALNSDNYRVIGALHAVFSIFDTHSDDGVLTGYNLEILDGVLGWPGFSAAMVAIEWLVEREGVGLVIPGFDKHNGTSAKRRANDSERKRASRNLVPVRIESGQIAPKSVTREEKRREEKSFGAASKIPVSRKPQVDEKQEQERIGLSSAAARVAAIPARKPKNDEATAQ
jgi:hypothetical protein